MTQNELPDVQRAKSRDEIERIVKQTIVEILNLSVEPDEIGSTEPLLDDGIGLDSVASVELIVALEDRFGFTIPDDSLSLNIFSSVRHFAEFIEASLGTIRDSRPPGQS